MKKISVSLPDGIVDILDKELVGKLGEDRSDALRTIIMSWLDERGYLAKGAKQDEHLPENVPSYTS